MNKGKIKHANFGGKLYRDMTIHEKKSYVISLEYAYVLERHMHDKKLTVEEILKRCRLTAWQFESIISGCHDMTIDEISSIEFEISGGNDLAERKILIEKRK